MSSELVAPISTRANTSGLRRIGPSMDTVPMPFSTLSNGLDWAAWGNAPPRSRNKLTAAAIACSASGWINHSLFWRTGFTTGWRCQRGLHDTGPTRRLPEHIDRHTKLGRGFKDELRIAGAAFDFLAEVGTQLLEVV